MSVDFLIRVGMIFSNKQSTTRPDSGQSGARQSFLNPEFGLSRSEQCRTVWAVDSWRNPMGSEPDMPHVV